MKFGYKKSFTAVVSCIFGAILFSGCQKKQEAAPKEEKIPTVEVALPLVKDVELWDEYTARIEGEKSVEVRSRVNGYLEKICFLDGDYVKEDQLLFEIDPRPFEAVVEACKASVSEIEARIDLAKSNLERAQELLKSNAISKELLESRKSELASASAVYLNAKAKLREAMLNLEFTKVRSPISGYVSKRFVDRGNLVSSDTTLMATIVSRDIVYAYFDISERDLIRYTNTRLFELINNAKKTGPRVELTLMDETKPSHFGYLSYVSNSLDASSIELRANIDNKEGKLYPGMYAKARLNCGKPEKQLLLPELAIGTDLVGRYVLVVNDDSVVEYRSVVVGDMIGNMQIIKSGLSAKDKVVINGIQFAVPQNKVNAILKELK